MQNDLYSTLKTFQSEPNRLYSKIRTFMYFTWTFVKKGCYKTEEFR